MKYKFLRAVITMFAGAFCIFYWYCAFIYNTYPGQILDLMITLLIIERVISALSDTWNFFDDD